MKSTPDHFPAKAGGVLGFLAMAVLGWNLAGAPAPTAKDTVTAEAKTRKTDRDAHRRGPSGPNAVAGKKLDGIRSATTPEARLRATFDLANSIPPSEIAAWLNSGWFNIHGGAERLLFRNILLARWREADPESLLVWSFKNDASAGQLVIESWAKNEPQRVLDFFKSHPDETAELRALRTLAGDSPALALQRLQAMASEGISKTGMENSFSLLRQLAGKSSSALEAALDSLPPLLRSQAEAALCGQRLATSFSTEIRALWDRPDGWKIFQTNLSQSPDLRGKIFDELANLPPEWKASVASSYYYAINEKDAVKWLDADLMGLGFSEAQAKKLRVGALQYMSYTNPEEMLKRMGEMNLSSDNRQNLISNMISSLGSDTEKAEALIARMDSEEDRKIARSTLEANKGGKNAAKTTNPAEWLEKISAVDPKSASNSYQYFSMLDQWDSGKKSELNQQFNSLPDDKKQQAAQVIAAGTRYSDTNTPLMGEAIRYLVNHPVVQPEGQSNSDTDPLRMASEYVSRLAVKDPEAAGDWVQSLPDGDPKLWAQKNLAKNWAQFDPKAADQWVKSLPSAARTEVRTFLDKKK